MQKGVALPSRICTRSMKLTHNLSTVQTPLHLIRWLTLRKLFTQRDSLLLFPYGMEFHFPEAFGSVQPCAYLQHWQLGSRYWQAGQDPPKQAGVDTQIAWFGS